MAAGKVAPMILWDVIYLATALVVGTIILSFGWRFISRRHTLPCPAWLAWALESPYSQWIAGSELLLHRLDLQRGMQLLDIGAGAGRISIPATYKVGDTGEVTALDLQQAMLDKLIARASGKDIHNLTTVHSKLKPGLFRPETFDRAIMVTVLGEIPEHEEPFKLVYDYLKPGGLLSITEILPDPHYQLRSTVARKAEAAGFTVEHTFGPFFAYTMNLRKPLETVAEEEPQASQ
ncbi:MAG: methyltransferase domain-containing protein [Candidatus Hydrogenedentes bacterium]|nr:methyltransferase domain-containing protein [Candidatus Hydrogenedentota bacterium]